jgi:excisionase family DNA binding protein
VNGKGPEGQLRRVPEVAAMLSLSRSKVYQLMESGELPYVKIGRSRRVKHTTVLRFIEQKVVGPDQAVAPL